SGNNQAIGLVARYEKAIDIDIAMIEARDCCFSNYNIIESFKLRNALRFTKHVAMHHGANLHVAAAALNRFESGVEIFKWNFSQKTQRTEIDSEHGDPRFGDRAGGRNQSAIATQNNNQIQRPR